MAENLKSAPNRLILVGHCLTVSIWHKGVFNTRKGSIIGVYVSNIMLSLPVPDVASPLAAGSGTVTAILARSLAGMPRGAVTGRVKPPGGRKLSLIA